MTDREKLIKYLERESTAQTFEELIVNYIKFNPSDFPPSKLVNLITLLSYVLNTKVGICELTLDNTITYANYLKTYLEGNMYTTKEAAEAAVDIQIKNVNKIIEYSEMALDKRK